MAHMVVRHGGILNVDGGDPFPTRLDHILAAVGDAHEAQGVNGGHIPGLEPALCIHCTALLVLQTPEYILIVPLIVLA